MYRVLRGDSSPVEPSARHRDGSYKDMSPLHAFRCIRNRFLALTLEENLQLPEHAEHEKKKHFKTKQQRFDETQPAFLACSSGTRFLSPFNGTTNGCTLETVVSQQSADMFVVVDMHKATFRWEAVVHKSPTFMRPSWSRLEFLMKNLHRPVGYTDASSSVVGTLWCARCTAAGARSSIQPKIFRARSAGRASGTRFVHRLPGRNAFVVQEHSEEVDPPQENRTAEMNFGCY